LSYNLSNKNLPKQLSPEDEVKYFTMYKANGCQKALNKIVESNLGFVRYIARNYFGNNLEFEDIFQQGTVGLLKAIDRYNLEEGVRFSSFCVHHIKEEILRYVYNNNSVVRAITTKPAAKIFNNYAKYKKSQYMTSEEIELMSKELNVSKSDIMFIDTYMSSHDESFDSPLSVNGEEDASTMHDTFMGEEDCAYISMREYDDVMSQLQASLGKLEGRDRDIFFARRMTEEPRILGDLADEYGISGERIRQIESRAFNTVKQNFLSLQ
jgi:RNA polymerase sigma-32 factor